jgi:type II secretory pathway pseudopilin PulG
MDKKNIKGVSILESLVCLVIIGIGFVAMLQLSSFSINAMDRSLEKNKLNFLSEMVLEDMIGDPDNVSNYSFDQTSCNYSAKGGTELYKKNKDKWRNKLEEKNYIKFEKGSGFKDKKLRCLSGDSKKTFVSNGTGRVNFFTGKGKRKKYLGVIVK